ncbi:MAG: CHRD domain-containing protein [Isosphaeraceae bacterium]|nr:CHRD domain-containing protein [Isosphaeraceae bacterium]
MRKIGWRSLLVAGALVTLGATGAQADFIPLTATLTGSQETPPNSSPGMGAASFILDDVAGTLTTAATFAGLTAPTILVQGAAAHIHMGAPGVAGPIIHNLPLGAGVTSGSFTDIWMGLTAAEIGAIKSGDTYINIHTTAFPGGEIRGQLTIIPEPSSLVLIGLGSLGLLGSAWRHRRQPVV